MQKSARSGVRAFLGIYDELPFWGAPRSFIAYAKKRGCLASVVHVTPSSFSWNGHAFEVDESWLQNSPGGSHCLYFTLKIDGKLQSNFNSLVLISEEEEDAADIIMSGQQCRRTKFGLVKALIPIFGLVHGGFIVHGVCFSKEAVLPNVVRLRVGTRNGTTVTVLGEEVLTFDLQSSTADEGPT